MTIAAANEIEMVRRSSIGGYSGLVFKDGRPEGI